MRTRVPSSTYRLQLTRDFGFDEAAAVLDYLDALGISHLYLSPVLQAAPGSTHGYDVVDHSAVSADLGGEDGLHRLAAAAHRRGMGLVVDVVPNHMAVPTPVSANRALWSVLRDGPHSPFARWFDVDWAAQDQAVLMPVLGRRIGQCLAEEEISLDLATEEPVLRYYDHVFPVRAGTESLAVPELVERQWYRLAHHRVGQDELNYRRFFDVDGLAAVRVEDPEVFEATHRLLLDLHADGTVDGFRIDHPDGLADPRGYVRQLGEAAPDAWIVVEKILEGLGSDAETLPIDWPCHGTTGYDTLNRVMGVLVVPEDRQSLTTLWTDLASAELRSYDEVVDVAKRDVVDDVLRAEVTRLTEIAHEICTADIALRDLTRRALGEALREVLVAVDAYRAYVVPGEDPPAESRRLLAAATDHAAARRPDLSEEIAVLGRLAMAEGGRPEDTRRAEFCIRFQQTCGPVMAKGVEDTAAYRYLRLVALNEVGGSPRDLGLPPDDVHAWLVAQHDRHPLGMTTLSTHDTKRSEDARARLVALAEMPQAWGEAVGRWERWAVETDLPLPDPETRYLLWQTLVGTWPIDQARLGAYLTKATREAKRHTSWTQVDERYEAHVLALVEAVLGDPGLVADLEGSVAAIDEVADIVVLSQKAMQLTAPGVPDLYQGCDLIDRSLVDPDNRRPVDFDQRAGMLGQLDALAEQLSAGASWRDSLALTKLLLTQRLLRLRRAEPALVGVDAAYRPLATSTNHAFAFRRGTDLLTVITRGPRALAHRGGWGEHTVVLPEGSWEDVVTGGGHDGADTLLATVLAHLPVAVLRRTA